MLFKQLQYFSAVVRLNSFTKAAEECFISQSAISQQIKALEAELGVTLLIRENRKFTLTPAGEYLYKQSRKLLEDVETLKRQTIQIACGGQDTLKLGYLKSYSGKELLDTVVFFNEAYPDTEVHIQNGNHEALYQLLRSEQLDLVLNDQRRAFSEEYVNLKLFEAKLYVLINHNNKFSGQESFEPEDLIQMPCILVASREQRQQEQDYYENTLGMGRNYLFAETIEEARLLVAGNRGYMISEAIGGDSEAGNYVKRIPLYRNGQQITKAYCLFWKKKRDSNKIRYFGEILKKQFEQSEKG